ncbi:response regulator transcription factor [Metabacillus sp. KIGAM252]|uniref:Response regulator transcription factor n=1 Tax=Metabacillus flavus TaxID=2823519 RepID=A0ABS5LHB3_9BACI|nr:response regulator transcription factor [Metabacillus flavus]MBS2970145.1 response regulator transcription factor [Metabacillus flavus]
MQKILLVDDEPAILDVCRRYLEREGYRVDSAVNGFEAVEQWKRGRPDLIVLDLMMPEKDGWTAAEEIRMGDEDVPIIMLTALGQERDRLLGLTLGADDYLTKPFSPRELVLRVKNMLRRTSKYKNEEKQSVTIGSISIDLSTRQVKSGGKIIDMTAKEFDMLWLLASHPSQVFSRSQLLEKVWGYDFSGDGNTVNVHVRRLREKLELNPAEPQYIKTVWGIGYKLEQPL